MINAESLVAVHTHTHTTFTNVKTLAAFLYPKIKRKLAK